MKFKLKKHQLKAIANLDCCAEWEHEGVKTDNGFIDFSFIKCLQFTGDSNDLKELFELYYDIWRKYGTHTSDDKYWSKLGES